MSRNWMRNFNPRRTSTYRPDSPNAILGAAGEIVVIDRLRFASRGSTEWNFIRATEDPIMNSIHGDIHVYRNMIKQFSIEVKASFDYRNVTITGAELLHSEAKYLVGATRAGIWATPMTEARRVTKEMTGPFSTYYLIPVDSVMKISVAQMLADCGAVKCELCDSWYHPSPTECNNCFEKYERGCPPLGYRW